MTSRPFPISYGVTRPESILLSRDLRGTHVGVASAGFRRASLGEIFCAGAPCCRIWPPGGCYWGRCEFCDHGEGYTAGYRTKKIQEVIAEVKFLRDKYQAYHFHFTDESYPPALFRKLTRHLKEHKLGIAWTTHIRFEKSLLDDEVWRDARDSGCKFLHMGYESGSERVLKLMDKATTTDVVQRSLELSSTHGVWNHVMGFSGFRASGMRMRNFPCSFWKTTRRMSTPSGSARLISAKHTPVAKNPERWGITYYQNPEWDLALWIITLP